MSRMHGWCFLPIRLRLAISWFLLPCPLLESFEPVRCEVVASGLTPVTHEVRERLYGRVRSRSRDRNGMWGL